MNPDNFRTNTLTLAGLLGYMVFLAAGILQILGYPVPWKLLAFFFLSSTALLGIDPGIDVFGPLFSQSHDRPDHDEDERDNQQEK